MIRIVSFCLALCGAAAAHAQEPLRTDVALAPPPLPLRHAGRAQRTTGIVLTATGATIAASGIGLATMSAVSMPTCDEGRPDCGMGHAFGIVGGGALAVVGTPFLAVGIPLWVVGDKRLRSHAVAVGVQPSTDGARVSLQGRF